MLVAAGVLVSVFAIAWIAAFIDLNTQTSAPTASSSRDEFKADPDARGTRSNGATGSDKRDLDKSNYQPMDKHSFELLAKDPDAHRGEKRIIYGWVSLFDAHTGNAWFLADVAPVRGLSAWNYADSSAVFLRDPSLGKDIVANDLVTLYVEVAGSYTYDTEDGGQATVPAFNANLVEKTGSTDY